MRRERERGVIQSGGQEREEGGREGRLHHMPLHCKLEQTTQKEALSCCCCLRERVSSARTHTHTLGLTSANPFDITLS